MKSRHFLQLIALSALWGASFLFLRIASPVLGPQVLATGRVALACVVLLWLMRHLQQTWPGREHAWPLLWLGISTVALPFWLFSWAALRLPAGYSALLNATAVLFGTLAAAAVGEQRLSAGKVLGCVLGFVGVGLIVRLGPVDPNASTIAGALACVAAAACYGISGPFLKRRTAHMEPLALATALHLAALLVMLPGGPWTLPEGAGRGDIGSGLLDAPAHDAACVLGGGAQFGIFDPGVWRHLGPCVSGRAAVGRHFCRRLVGAAGHGAGDRVYPAAPSGPHRAPALNRLSPRRHPVETPATGYASGPTHLGTRRARALAPAAKTGRCRSPP